jgi:choloylglycine hydrolase
MKHFTITLMILVLFGHSIESAACTGLRLIAKDGSVIAGRTMEWGAFDLHSRVTAIPKGHVYYGTMPDGKQGLQYISKYNIIAIDLVGKDYIGDGMNEKGLYVGMFYEPGFAIFKDFDKKNADKSISSQDVASYILSQYSTIDEVKQGIANTNVVGVIESTLGIILQAHWMITDKTGKSIVIEYSNKELRIFDNTLGVLTNSPSYDWHLTNVRNYVNLTTNAYPPLKLSGEEYAPIGAGTGMLGLPGDFTPPSRFIRVAAWSHSTRELENSKEAVYELFRILDNFQLPYNAPATSEPSTSTDLMRSSTLWTTAWNLSDLTLNYHTQNNRRVRQLNFKNIDFSKNGIEITRIPMDEKKEQDIKELSIK